jgi:hypothetical protein
LTIYITQANMSKGELAPRLSSRFDVDLFKQGVKYSANWAHLKHGGVTKRPGSQYMAGVKTHSKKVRMIPFVFGTLSTGPQSYALEFGDQYIRVYTTAGQVLSAGVPVEIASPYLEAELFQIDYVQSADVLYLTHPNYQTRELTRTSDTAWTLTTHKPDDGPYLDEPKEAHATLTFSATGNLVPDMTSDTAPSGTSAVTNGAGGPAWQAFDRNKDTSATLGDNATSTLSYDFAGATTKVCTGYSMMCREQRSQNGPLRWTFEGDNGTNWVVLDVGFQEDGWGVREKKFYEVNNKDAFNGYRLNIQGGDEASGGSASISIVEFQLLEDPTVQSNMTCTASSTAGINGGSGFSANDIGRPIRLKGDDGLWRWFEIKAFTSSTVVSGVIHGCPLFTDSQIIRTWRLGAWGTASGWPRHVSFFDERLGFGGTAAQPSKVWLSKTGDFADQGVSTPLLDDDALALQMTGGEINSIQFLAEGYDLLIGTTGSIRTIGPNNTNEGFSASNAKQTKHSTYAAAGVKPVSVGNTTIFADYYNHLLRELTYSFELNGYTTPELTLLSEHLFKSGIVQLGFSQDPIPIVVSPVNNGMIVATTYDRDQKVVASGRWILGGTSVVVESACCIPGPDRHEIWASVKRTINGSTKRYVERFAAFFDEDSTLVEDGKFLDAHINYSGVATNSFGGVTHLASSTVTILANGIVHTNRAVDGSGNVSLPAGVTATKACIGIPYQSKLILMRVPDPSVDGSRWGRRVKVQEVFLDVLSTLGIKAGTQNKLFDVIIRDQNDPVPGPMLLRTEIIKTKIEASWFNQVRDMVTIQSDDPLPATILSVTLAVEGEP